MTVSSLTVSGFRNLVDTVFIPDPGVNLLFGDNAQGKTNLIEAIWLFTGSKSFRSARDAELQQFGSTITRLSLCYESSGRQQEIRLSLDETRHASLNGVALDSPVRLAGEFCAVVFSPEHLGLVKEGPDLRRRFLDAAICQLKPRHASLLVEYKKSLSQRNALIKDIPSHSELLETLDIWDDRLCALGATVVFTRLRYLRKLSQKAADIYADISNNGEFLTLTYKAAEKLTFDCDLENPALSRERIAETLKKEMLRQRNADIQAGYTHAGPHRDDMEILINDISAKSFGSQGQQRSAVLALKLSEASVLRETLHEPPVLLLDDVMSELDRQRQQYLLSGIRGHQVFITCCDPSACEKTECGSLFKISHGQIEKV